MKKIMTIFLVLISSLIINNNIVYAKSADDILPHAGVEVTKENNTNNCKSVFGSIEDEGDTAYYMHQAFQIMKFAGIILAIAMTIKDLITAMTEQKNEMYAKLPSKTVKRIAYAIAIFMLPTIIEFLFSAIGLYGATCNIK